MSGYIYNGGFYCYKHTAKNCVECFKQEFVAPKPFFNKRKAKVWFKRVGIYPAFILLSFLYLLDIAYISSATLFLLSSFLYAVSIDFCLSF